MTPEDRGAGIISSKAKIRHALWIHIPRRTKLSVDYNVPPKNDQHVIGDNNDANSQTVQLMLQGRQKSREAVVYFDFFLASIFW